MASKKNKKKRNNAAASISERVPQDNKTPKELKAKGKLAKKSSNLNSAQMKEAVVTPRSQSRNKEKNIKDGNQGNNVEATPQSQSRNKEKNIKDGNQGNNVEATLRSQSRNKEKNIKDANQGNFFDKKDARKSLNIKSGNKGKGSTSEMSVDGKAEKDIGGVIFMCNAKTKDDCFKYHVMGVSAMKKDIILGIKPGLKLFLFDVDLKLMYGIYEASSAGGMKLEPAAFGGDFPAQVRFRIDKECLPLPENLFKRAIQDSYDERTHKFKIELTFKQVGQLKRLFTPAPWLHPTSKHSVSEPVNLPPSAAPLPSKEHSREHVGMQYGRSKAGENFSLDGHERERQQHAGHRIMPKEVDSEPRFLTEKEYRSYGLQSAKHLQALASAVVGRTLDHYESEQGREHLRRNPTEVSSDVALARKETVLTEPLFPSEREYRTYGLKARSEMPATVAPGVESGATIISATPTNHGLLNHVKDTYNPYDESTTSLVNRYLSLPRTLVTPVVSYSLTDRESFVSDPCSAIDIRGHTGKFHTENEGAYPPAGRFHAENERAYPPMGRFHTENERAYPPMGRFHTENERAYPPTERFHTENERAYPPTERFHTENERAYPPTGRFHTENERAYPPTGRFHTENERAYPPTGRFHTENERAYPPTGRFHTENERAYPPYARQLPPEYGLKYHHVRDEPRYPTLVSSRYSLGEPSAPRR
ncbi:uncharacterized protein LOC129882886 [Solanum dulcamara]|uniref:uncharacterized protein LOC129882886 n=1 Tax=Solanum dulcamara TaxID=45834 RepID=UPI002484EBA2|nr:uncharacterized protein LOC129882886 [Solanum dulcamara]XP_055813352.1 uncharacterized protein LOC129882886 [Solanum dulcamara]